MHHRDEGDVLPDIVDHFQQAHKISISTDSKYPPGFSPKAGIP